MPCFIAATEPEDVVPIGVGLGGGEGRVVILCDGEAFLLVVPSRRRRRRKGRRGLEEPGAAGVGGIEFDGEVGKVWPERGLCRSLRRDGRRPEYGLV